MKHLYKIKVAGQNLYYNKDYNFLTEKHGTVYTSLRKAKEDLEYAEKYANSGGRVLGIVEVSYV